METISAPRASAPKKKFVNMLERMESSGNKSTLCPVKDVLHTLTDKWSMLVMINLGARGTMRFNELKGIIPGISQKMLTVTLKHLEASGLVHREMFAQIPPRVEYTATPLGEEFLSHLIDMLNWACVNSKVISKSRKQM